MHLYQEQEPLRSVAWIGAEKKLTDIYLTSSLELVSGGSIGFAIEAAWYGFTPEFVYSGSSSPQTGWLPSYRFAGTLEPKSQIEKIAIKTTSDELKAAVALGFHVPTNYEPRDSLPGKIAVESSNWFLEMLYSGRMVDKGSTPPKTEIQTKVVYHDSPEILARMRALMEEVEELRRKAGNKAESYKDERDFFEKPTQPPPKPDPKQVEKKKKEALKPKLPEADVVKGYPKITLKMAGVDEIN